MGEGGAPGGAHARRRGASRAGGEDGRRHATRRGGGST
ncbi:Hypothetical protein CAP_3602 [Chondromyces apiculatus DSM 436]|uniref:Uncharacterized protein n=1 Tax=Chondromyces apiculatus DSM 436 TaxID=1192034 RepID=A0A017T7S3_9BACT|nr:Hypothetical protein CAP_3602 [Chondromyces apiculatus DSM 436]